MSLDPPPMQPTMNTHSAITIQYLILEFPWSSVGQAFQVDDLPGPSFYFELAYLSMQDFASLRDWQAWIMP